MRALHVLLTAGLALLAACSCPPTPNLERYQTADLATPEGTLEYLRLAVKKRDAYQINLCLSERFREEVGLTVAIIESYMADVVQFLDEKIGNLDSVEIHDADFVDEETARVLVTTPTKRQVVELTRETSYWIQWKDGPRIDVYEPPFRAELIRRNGSVLELELPIGRSLERDPHYRADDVYLLRYEQGWRILGLPDRDLAGELKQRLREAEQKQKKPPPSHQ